MYTRVFPLSSRVVDAVGLLIILAFHMHIISVKDGSGLIMTYSRSVVKMRCVSDSHALRCKRAPESVLSQTLYQFFPVGR